MQSIYKSNVFSIKCYTTDVDDNWKKVLYQCHMLKLWLNKKPAGVFFNCTVDDNDLMFRMLHILCIYKNTDLQCQLKKGSSFNLYI